MRPGGPAARVRVRELGPAFDLLAAFDPADGFFMERSGSGVAAAGPGIRVSVAPGERQVARGVEALAAAFAGVPADDGVAPVAVGAFPFDATSEATIVIPSRSVVRLVDGTTREVSLAGWAGSRGSGASRRSGGDPAERGVAAERRFGRAAPFAPFESIRVRYVPPPDDYAERVRSAVARIRRGELRKVVLARTAEVEPGRRIDARSLLHRLRSVDPSAYTFAVPAGHASDPALLVGASPELLVSRRGREVRANPLAGSAPRAGDPDVDRANADRLASDGKNLEEHAIVVEAVAALLGPVCDELTWDREPVLLETANVWHLSTRFRGVLGDPPPSALELVAALHPTPAVCGDPIRVARAAIRELEPFERGCYAGPVGWVDAGGDGEWAIALRCAALHGERAILYAGAGIVAGSRPDDEVDETDRKFRAFLDALRWG
jgi:isochorismate synthase